MLLAEKVSTLNSGKRYASGSSWEQSILNIARNTLYARFHLRFRLAAMRTGRTAQRNLKLAALRYSVRILHDQMPGGIGREIRGFSPLRSPIHTRHRTTVNDRFIPG